MTLSVVIATHKRADILRRCLEHLMRQTAARDMEVIVVSDGPDEKTSSLFDKQTYPVPVVFKTIPKSHQGVARNEGVKIAKGERILFINDDIFLGERACEMHVRMSEKVVSGQWSVVSRKRDLRSSIEVPLSISSQKPTDHCLLTTDHSSVAILGFTTWDPALSITPVMRWLERSGWQFGYPMIANFAHDFLPANIQHRFTYTSHISVPIQVARDFPFREDVRLYGWEDIEWGLRLKNAGIRLYYEPDATAVHHHPMTMDESLARMRTLGQSVVHLSRLVPELDRQPKGMKLLAYRALSLLPTMDGRHRKTFLEGMKKNESHHN